MAFISEDTLMLRKGRHGSEPWPLWTETKGSGDFQQDSFQNVPVHSFQSHLERYWAHGEAAAVTQCLCHFEEKEKKKKGSQRDRDSDFYNSSFLQTTYLSNSAKYHTRHHSLLISGV